MRIAIVSNTTSFKGGGVESFTRDIRKILRERGHEVNVIGIESLPKDSPKKDLELEVGEHFNLLNKEREYGVVLCNGEFGYAVKHPRAINVFHGNYFSYAKAVEGLVDERIVRERLGKVKKQVISSQGKHVVTVSRFNEIELEKLGISVNGVINHSVDPDIFFPQDLKIRDYCLALSRGMYFEKGFDILKHLAGTGIKIRLYSDEEIDSQNVENMGFEDDKNFCGEYNQSQLLLNPSRFEGGGLTTLEAMACGCPVITTPTGYGYDIKAEIPNFVAEDISQFLAKYVLVTNEREKHSRQALEYFREFHDPQKFKSEWISLIEEI